MEQEAEFFAALESAATYTVDGDFIELRNATTPLPCTWCASWILNCLRLGQPCRPPRDRTEW